MTETAITIGYMLAEVTPKLIPIEAMIKENSPICASENPD